MSGFTLTLAEALEYTGGTWELQGSNTIISGGNIGLNHYEIFDEAHRPILNGRIFDHYMNMEIGMETIDVFILAMRRRMNEIMPVYNKMYLAELQTFNPLSTMRMQTESDSAGTSNTESTSTNNSASETDGKSRAVSSETPQTMLAGNGDYATAANDANSNTSVSGSSSDTGESETRNTQTGLTTVSGYSGNPALILQEYRNSLVSVDAMVVSELRDMFMLVFNPPGRYSDSYTLERYTHNG